MRPTPARFIFLIPFGLRLDFDVDGSHPRRRPVAAPRGRNKAALQLAPPGGASVLDRQLARLRRVVDRTIIIANDAEAFAATGVR